MASESEADLLERPTKPADGVPTHFASAFRDDKLHAVHDDSSGAWPADGERGVLSGLSDTMVVRTGSKA